MTDDEATRVLAAHGVTVTQPGASARLAALQLLLDASPLGTAPGEPFHTRAATYDPAAADNLHDVRNLPPRHE